MKRSKKTPVNYVDDDDDDDLWDFKFLKRTKKQTKNVESKDAKSTKTSTNKSKRKVTKLAAERLKSQLDSSSEDSDCLIISSQNGDSDFKENRKRAFLSSTGINDDLIKRSTSSNQTLLLVDNDELSQKVKKSPQCKSSEKNKQPIQKRRGSAKKNLDKNKDSSHRNNPKISKKSSNKDKSNQERCPFCQVPFSVLLRLSPNAHTMECMDLPFLPDIKECPDGLTCRSNLPSHYRKFAHAVIAENTANRGGSDDHSTETSADGRKDVDVSVNVGTAQEDVCIKVTCTSNSTSLKRSTSKDSSTSMDTVPETSISRVKDSGVSSNETNRSKSSPHISKAGSENFNCSSASSLKSDKMKSSSKELSFDSDEEVVPEESQINSNKSSKIVDSLTERKEPQQKGNKSHLEDVDWDKNEDVDKDGGFLLIDEEEEDKDLDDLLAGSENGEDTLEIEEEEDDDDIQETAEDVDNIDNDDGHDENWTNDTGDTGFDDDNDINDKNDETLEIESRSDDFELCDKKEIEPVSISNSQEEKVVPSLARKQTSIFSFFSGPKGSSNKNFAKPTTASCDISDLKKGLAKIASSPSLKASKPDSSYPLKKAISDVTSNQSAKFTSDYTTGRGGKKMCPFYKKIPGTSLTVDAFRYGVIPGCNAYILTHFHYDHYGGLTKHFKQPLYCSKVTGNLVKSKIRVDGRYIQTLPLDEPRVVEGVELTLMEANHCPGAVIILFKLKSGQTFLHTGDFRANTAMESYPPLVGTKIHQLYLDTTYCDPAYSFPSQRDVINFAVTLSIKHMETCPKSLIVCGSYTIGKERIFIAIAEALDSRVCVKRDKKQIIDCLEDPRVQNRVTLVPGEATVHVLPMGKLNPTGLSEYLSQNSQFSSILALEPTGWSHSNRVVSLDQIRPKYSRNGITIYGVPYSEHSSYLEMKRFTQFIKPDRILPTVNNANPQSRKKMEDIFRKWMTEIKPDPANKESKPINKQVSLKSWFSQ